MKNAKNVQIKHYMTEISKNEVFSDTYPKSEKVVNKFGRNDCLDLYTLFHNLEGFVYHIELRGGGKRECPPSFQKNKGG